MSNLGYHIPRTLLQQPIPAHLEKFFLAQWPDSTQEYRQSLFDDMANLYGAYDKAVGHFESIRDTLESGAVIGVRPSFLSLFPRQRVLQPERPPANSNVKVANIGPFAIFYHPVWPAHLKNPGPLMFNFYIGWSGQGQDSIMTDWQTQGVTVELKDFKDEWVDNSLLVVAPSARIRITHPQLGSEELIFPADPRQVNLRTHYLE
ncbi:hypothetical protein C8F01DRAFT_1259076 [Mycena amicta]|nr:hypothetical protein C8F01DRAFT_1259076 [Mycena amicta]